MMMFLYYNYHCQMNSFLKTFSFLKYLLNSNSVKSLKTTALIRGTKTIMIKGLVVMVK